MYNSIITGQDTTNITIVAAIRIHVFILFNLTRYRENHAPANANNPPREKVRKRLSNNRRNTKAENSLMPNLFSVLYLKAEINKKGKRVMP